MRKSWVIFSLVLVGTTFAGRYDLTPAGSPSGSPSATQENTLLSTPVSVNVRNVPLTYLASLLSQHVKTPIVLRDIAYPQQVVGGQQTITLGQGGQLQGGQTQAQSEYFTLSYFADGKRLSQVLDEITGMFDLWWKVEGGRIVIYKYENRVMVLRLPFLQKKIDEKNGGLSLSYQREFTKNLEASLQKMLRDSSSKVSVDEMGNVYVSARPSEVQAVESAVGRINENFTKPIPLKIKVYLVNDRDFSSLGISWNAKEGGISAGLNPAVANPIFNLSIATTRIEMQLNALAQSGKAKLIEDSVLSALNGQPMVYSPLQKQRIISRFELTYISSGAGAPPTPAITMQTEDISTGSMLIIVPYFVDEGTIAVDLYRKQDSLEKLDTRRVDLAGFQNELSLPLVSTKTNINQTLLKRGETLVMFSTAQTLEQFRDSGVPFLKDIPILGQLFSTKEKTKELFRLVITMEFI
jgi:type II secretory pathway component GspD/PulD (secretin)